MNAAVDVVTTLAALGSGCVGGVLFAFSGFVMPALRRSPPAIGVAAMQAINRSAVGPPLMVALFGTAATAIAVPALAALAGVDRSALTLVGVASLLYLLGTVGVTVVANVPLNHRLAAQSAAEVTAEVTADAWTSWVAAWTLRNHLRTVAALAATVLYCAALAS